MNRVIICFFFFLLTAISTSAQHTLTLQQCIDSSLAHNIPVKQYELLAQSAQVNWKQARMNLLPDLNKYGYVRNEFRTDSIQWAYPSKPDQGNCFGL